MTKENQIVEYGVTDAALATLTEKYSVVPDASTKEGYAEIKAGLKELSPLRIDVEKKRKELKAEALAYGKKVDGEAKRITGVILDLETPFKEAKQYHDEEAARIKQAELEKEQARIDAIKQKVTDIDNLIEGLLGADVETLESRLEEARKIEVTNVNFEDFIEQARESMAKTVETLEQAITERKAFEQQQAEQAERQRVMDEQAAEQAKKQAELDEKQAKLDAEEAERTREAREQQIAKEAAEKATQEAEQAAAKREQGLKEAAERAERETKETEERLLREAEEKKQREIEEAEAREKNKKHKASINNAAVEALVAGGMTKTAAKQAITLIAKREIPNVTIAY